MNWLPRITELSRQVENGATGGFSAMQQLVAEVEAASSTYAGLAFRTIGAAGCDLYDAINGARTTEEVMRLVKAAKAKLDALPEYEMGILSGEREAIARWMVQHGYATGHGDTVDDLLQHLVREATERSPAVGNLDLPSVDDRGVGFAIIEELDAYAREFDVYEYGLPMYDDHKETMLALVLKHLPRRSLSQVSKQEPTP